MYKNILILLIFIGIICVIIGYTNSKTVHVSEHMSAKSGSGMVDGANSGGNDSSSSVCSDRIIYRFIPRTLEEDLDSPVPVTDVFRTMFNQPDPWIRSIDNMTLRKREDINQFFITQF
jgi:hypothetical protein